MVAEIAGSDRLYDNEDPCQPVTLLCYETGDRSAWHFDSVNGLVTLTFRSLNSFMRPFAQMPRGFYRRGMSGDGGVYRSH